LDIHFSSEKFNPINHPDPTKIDAMFFATTEETLILLGDEGLANSNINSNLVKNNDFHSIGMSKQNSQPMSSLLKHERRYRDMDTFILCNPNAMSY